jgi:hypothetical protein
MGELKREKKNGLFASPRSVICAHSYSATLVCVKKEKKGRRGGIGGAIRAPHLIQLVGAFNRHTQEDYDRHSAQINPDISALQITS